MRASDGFGIAAAMLGIVATTQSPWAIVGGFAVVLAWFADILKGRGK